MSVCKSAQKQSWMPVRSMRCREVSTNNERIDLDSMRDYSVYEEEYNTTGVCYK